MQNHWTIKYLQMSDYTSVQSMMPSHLIQSEIQGKITGPGVVLFSNKLKKITGP